MARDFAAAEAMLAPWLAAQLPAGSLRKLLRQAREDRPRLHGFSVSENTAITFNDLREGLEDVSQITEENFRAWLCVEFYPDPDLHAGVDLSYKLGVAVVALENRLAAGYLQPDA